MRTRRTLVSLLLAGAADQPIGFETEPPRERALELLGSA